MKKLVYLSLIATLASSVAFASGLDQRIHKDSCGANTAAHSEIKEICLATITATKKQVVALQKKSEAWIVLGEVKSEQTTAVGGEEGGIQEWKLNLSLLDSDLNYVNEKKVSHAKVHTEWEYSQGYTSVSGKTPDGEAFDGVVIDPTDHQ